MVLEKKKIAETVSLNKSQQVALLDIENTIVRETYKFDEYHSLVPKAL